MKVVTSSNSTWRPKGNWAGLPLHKQCEASEPKAVILFMKHVTQQLGNRKFCGTFAQLGVHDFVPQLLKHVTYRLHLPPFHLSCRSSRSVS